MDPGARPILDMNAFDAARDAGGGSPLLRRRQQNFGPLSVLFYREPLEMVRASGCWMESTDGKRYLDFYNNVPSVGHCHPRVVEAVSRQLASININSRYLHQATEEYLERLKATLPPNLDNVAMVCSGSEANDLALRVARCVSGGTGFIVTEAAYHGNTQSVTEISPSAYKRGTPPGHVCVIAAPSEAAYGQDVARGMTEAVAHAIEALAGRGHQLAGLICDSIFSSDGVFADPAGFLQAPVELVRKAGGLYIADEVQPGFARTGDSFWGFARHHLQPDIVTLGKPMGNGFPMAAVAAPTGAMAAFCKDFGYFNTFGGTPAAAAAGLAVLDVIEEEQLQDNALKVGRHLQQGLQRLAATDPRIAATRGAGLFIGVDLGKSAGHDAPDPELASAVINRLRDRQVLIGAAGRFGNTLKIRPPLCLSTKEADFFLDALRSTLHSIPADETGH
ncbi:MAG: hypothetical protein RL434_1729 [Pseudomonadota bacterium]